jgi:hypothetical protein
MQQPPHIADSAPDEPFLTGYDMAHLVTYLRLLDADAEGAAWQEAARIVLSLDVETEPERANRVWASHLARAKWMTEQGYRHLLRGGAAHLSVFGAPHARHRWGVGLVSPAAAAWTDLTLRLKI